MSNFNRVIYIMINLIVITIILSQMDPYGNQLAQQYVGLYISAGILALLTLYHLIIFIDQYILSDVQEEEKHDPIMPEIRRKNWTNPTIERLKTNI